MISLWIWIAGLVTGAAGGLAAGYLLGRGPRGPGGGRPWR